jgi:DNA (cytosine-5)-methyltransferase 1
MNKNKDRFYAIDLFAGCGGLSEGFRQTGFEVIAQVEMDKWACETLKTRFLYYKLKEGGKGHLYDRFAMEKISQDNILSRYPEIRQLMYYTVIQAEFGKESIKKIIGKIENAREIHGSALFPCREGKRS